LPRATRRGCSRCLGVTVPELPDVEYYRTYAQATSLHKEIVDLELTAPRLLEGTSRQLLARRLNGASFEKASRHGKHLFLNLSSRGALMVHFGMTGLLRYYEEADDPDHSRLIVRFANGGNLACVNTRMLGRISIVDSVEDYVKQTELGPDALEITVGALRDLIRNGRGSIRAGTAGN
jgi:formamidopyrimidine-DNA glycosylase